MRRPHRGAAAALAIGALLGAACSSGSGSAAPTTTTAAPVTTTSATSTTTTTTIPLDQSLGPVAAPVRSPATARAVYFVMPDRFENGDPSNDTGGIDGGPLDHGFDPTRRGYHHGGDLAGLRSRLPYIADMGFEALWLTPPFTNRYVQGNGTLDGSSSSYHGYWQVDFETIDPHLGTNDDMRALVDEAHALGMDVYFDVVVNHTGDVISFAEDTYGYRSRNAFPYLDASGTEFDPNEFVGTGAFPELDPEVSFAYTPVFSSPELATIKSPDWLNDVTLYHNRGNTTFQGESSLDGDFFGLDDLFTEHPRVVEGMIDLHADMIERFDIDGFRVDTMKHVNIEFWEEFSAAIKARAAELGKPDFYFFGEVAGTDAILQSSHTNAGVPATLDFIVNEGIRNYVTGGPAERIVDAFDKDDWFTDADNNASMQVTFFGNHDEGRMGYRLKSAEPSADDLRLLARSRVALDLLFLTRGTPAVYYGDEQGFTGDGGDQLARHDMFPSQVPEYLDDDLIGTDATPADSNFDPGHPLYQHIQWLTDVRREHPTFASGAQIEHEPIGSVFAFSRVDRDERIEYVVLTNSNASLTVPARFDVLSAATTFEQIGGDGQTVRTSSSGEMFVDVPPLATIILRAETPVEPPAAEPVVVIERPRDGGEIPSPRFRIQASLDDRRFAEVTFAASVDGAEPIVLGVDDAPPYRIYWDSTEYPDGAEVEIIATVNDGSGRLRSDLVTVTLGDR